MPDDAPVTTATFPFIDPVMLFSSDLYVCVYNLVGLTVSADNENSAMIFILFFSSWECD